MSRLVIEICHSALSGRLEEDGGDDEDRWMNVLHFRRHSTCNCKVSGRRGVLRSDPFVEIAGRVNVGSISLAWSLLEQAQLFTI